MPQMMPLSWLMLFFMFSTTMVLFATMNYYMMISKPNPMKKSGIMTKMMNWKW
uniref:ATP synthase F0 subunit 8 n=1 Tax=Incisitermes cf. incisus TaxID=2942755 RepID=A0A8X8RGM3_9NEOP|nr:ATP synthase F0 subunit 8 [Incisitermes cf. incisus]